jgi:hypothetical protein
MISVYITDNGDIAYRCSVCDETSTLPVRISGSAFWDIYVGLELLKMLAHYREAHSE